MVTKKTISFAMIHFTITFLIVWLLTGDAFIGGVVAMVEPTVNTVAYFFHEKAWDKVAKKKMEKSNKCVVRRKLAYQAPWKGVP